MSTILGRVKKKNRKPDLAEAGEPEATGAEAADDATGEAPAGDGAEDVQDVQDGDTAEADGDEATGEVDDAAEGEADADDDEFAFEDDDDLDDDDEDDGKEKRAAPRIRMRTARQILVVLALVALVLSGAVFYLLHRLNDARAVDEAGDAAVSAARVDAQDLLAYDYRNLDSDFARGLAATTGGFHDQYQKTTSQLVKPRAAKQRVIVQAAVINAGLISAHDDHAVVLVFVDRITTKAGQKKPAFDQDRVRMSMTKVNGKWLVSKLDAL